MAQRFQAIRGMKDILPEKTPFWQGVEAVIKNILSAYGYNEIRTPIVESTELFSRSIGEVTDIVEKEMYTFPDRDGESLTLRPEATAGLVRACVEHGLLHNQIQRIWCNGPMFRHEKPQKERYRQFYQIDVEAFGMPGPDIDAELICLSARFWQHLGIKNVTLQINSLGSSAARVAYRERLLAYFNRYRDVLDEDSQRRLHGNPLRILDSKNPTLQPIIADAPLLMEHLDEESRLHFERLKILLDAADIPYTVNPHLVRGLDYYCKTVFEWVTDRLGAQSAICAGGRYDGLVEHLGGRQVPGIGFAMGLERLIALLAETGYTGPANTPHAYLVVAGEAAEQHGLVLAETLREQLPALRLHLNCGGGSFKSQFKRADRSGARLALILGEDEINAGRVTVKDLRESGAQTQLREQELTAFLRTHLILG